MRRIILPVAAVLTTVSACGGGGDDGGFVRAQLAAVPAGAADASEPVRIVITDLERLSELAGLAGPDADRTGDELARWTGDMTFQVAASPSSKPVGFLPNPVGSVAAWTVADDVRAATGVALGGVERMITVESPPLAFTVMSGDVELSDSLTDVGDGVVSYGDGDDLSIGEPTSWNQTGAPVRFATNDGAIAWSRTGDLAAEFAAGAERTLADQPELGALADTLDSYGSVSAYLVAGQFDARPPLRANPAQAEEFRSRVPDVDRFTTVGLGVTVVEGEARTIVAYAFADEDAAAAALDALTTAWSDGADADGRPIDQQLAVFGSEVVGTTVAIELVPVGGATTLTPVQLLLTETPVFMHP